MTTIWKYEVPVDDTVVVDLGRAELVRWLHVEAAGAGALTLWAEVTPRDYYVQSQETLHVRGTGNPMTGDEGRHIGTVIAAPFADRGEATKADAGRARPRAVAGRCGRHTRTCAGRGYPERAPASRRRGRKAVNAGDQTGRSLSSVGHAARHNGRVTRTRRRPIPMPRGTSKRVDAQNDLRRGEMLDLWLRGHTYTQIAEKMGMSPKSHASIIRQVQRELTERGRQRVDLADQALELQLQRIEAILQTHMSIATNAGDPLAAARSARVALEAIDRLNRMLGLDQPQRHEVTVNTVDEIDREIAALTAKLTGHAERNGIHLDDMPMLTAIAEQAGQ